MGVRRLVPLLLVAACPAKSPTPAEPARPGAVAPAVTGGSTVPAASGGSTATTPPAPSPAAPAAPSGPASNATLAEVGLEATSLDRTADPCVDFYQFACGGWLQANPIPADRSSWSRFGELHESTNAALRSLLEDAAKTGGQLGDYYQSCMDLPAIEKAGLVGVKPLLDRTQKVKDAKSWLAAVAALHAHGIWVAWTTTTGEDLKDSTKNITWLDGGRLGLPDRDYYLKPELAAKVTAYKEHVQRMLALANVPKPDVQAANVLAVELALAKVTKTQVEKRDAQKAYNPTDSKALGKQVKSVDWKAYWKALKVTPSARISVTSPAYFAALDGLRKQLPPAQWASYFTYHALMATAMSLPKAFDDEAFALYRSILGVTEQRPRQERCVESVAQNLGELLGKEYVAKHFPAQSKQTAAALVAATIEVMTEELGGLSWMSEPTRKTAQDKLAKLVQMIGYPDKWRSYGFKVTRGDFAANLLSGKAFEVRYQLAKAGKPVDRGEWLANAFRIDAYFNPAANTTALLAGILQPPFFGQDRGVAVNMGGIGMVIGHELTHGFDDQGAKFDAQGNLRDWWAPADKTAFETRGKCLADQYGTFEVLPKQYINGELTLGENIADLGGVKMAFKAYRSLRAGAPAIVADGFTEDQQFFLATAQSWCSKHRPDDLQRRLLTDPHSPPKFRVYGALRNLPEFASAFSCAPGTPMRPAQTCTVW